MISSSENMVGCGGNDRHWHRYTMTPFKHFSENNLRLYNTRATTNDYLWRLAKSFAGNYMAGNSLQKNWGGNYGFNKRSKHYISSTFVWPKSSKREAKDCLNESAASVEKKTALKFSTLEVRFIKASSCSSINLISWLRPWKVLLETAVKQFWR